MSLSRNESVTYMKLREDAEALLKSGTAPVIGGHALGPDALILLHRLSSDPESAGDALRLLHELQVHQVELDLQIDQAAANEREMVEDLARFRTLYDFAPFAYFLVDREGKILDSNHAGAELVGVRTDELIGRRISGFLRPESRSALLEQLQQPFHKPWTIEVAMDVAKQTAHSLQIMARLSPDAGYILLACCECPQPRQA